MTEERTPEQRAEALYNGNTKLLSALMGMVGQFFYGHNGTYNHACMSCEEEAIDVLIEAGLAREVKGGYYLEWDKLAARVAELEGRAAGNERDSRDA